MLNQDKMVFQFDTLYESNLGGSSYKFGPIRLYQIGEISCMSGYTVPPHKQWCHEISYVISGEGVFAADNDVSLLVAGDMQFCPRDATHTIMVSGSEDIRYAYIGFSLDEDSSDHACVNQLRDYFNTLNIYKASGDSRFEKTFFRCMDEFYDRSEFSLEMIEAYLLQLLILAYRSFENQTYVEYFPQIELNASKRPVYLVAHYVSQHIFEKMTVQGIADELGYNFSYLSAMFKEANGMTISQYISKNKIQKSVDLMQSGKFSLEEIAERLNFSSLQSFTRAFKRNMDVTPAKFIKDTFPQPGHL